MMYEETSGETWLKKHPYLIKARNIAVRLRVFIFRCASYLNGLNALLLWALFLSNVKDKGLDAGFMDYVPYFLVGLVLIMLVGLIDDLYFFRQEQKAQENRNPYTMDIWNRVQKIEKILEEMKNEKK